MNSRKRVFAALEHRQPYRCPVDFRVEDAARKTLLTYFGFTDEQPLIEKSIQNILAMYDTAIRQQRFIPLFSSIIVFAFCAHLCYNAY